jgi:hypothetical protein
MSVVRGEIDDTDEIWSSFNHPHGASTTNSTTGITEPGGSGSAGSGVGVRVTFVPNLLHRTPIQILYLDIKQIIRELYRALAHPLASALSSSSSIVPSSTAAPSSHSQVYKKQLPATPAKYGSILLPLYLSSLIR